MQWPFFFRNLTKSASGSLTAPRAPAARRIAAKLPSNRASPSASTSSRSP